MAKANQQRISSQVRRILNEELGSHAQAHIRHTILAESDQKRSRSRLGEHDLDRYRVLESMPTYALTIAEGARSGLKDPERNGFVLLIQWSSGLLGKVEIHEKQGQLALTRVSSGALALQLERLIRRMRGRSGRQSKSAAEIRVFSVPGIHLLCLWKHWLKNPSRDSLTPIMRNFIGLRSGQVYSRSHVNAVVGRAATEVIIAWYERQQAGKWAPTK